MKYFRSFSVFIVIIAFVACQTEPTALSEQTQQTNIAFDSEANTLTPQAKAFGNIVTANRASKNISVIDTRTDKVSGTYSMPDNGEPMYVVWSPSTQTVWVGDRSNDKVVIFDANDFSIKGSVPAGKGVFHMWAQPNSDELWVVNDIDNTISVINMRTMQNEATIPLPEDLVAQGGKPHDVITGPFGRSAYVTMLGFSSENDYVVHYDMLTHRELNRAPVGKDPHLSLHPRVNQQLYVPTQNSNSVFVLNRFTLDEITVLDIPGAHGAGMAWNGKTFYTTNLPNGGADGLFSIDTRSNNILSSIDTYEGNMLPIPHNIALTPKGKKLYVTHSGGASNRVTVYHTKKNGDLKFITEIEVGFNPFGLAYSGGETPLGKIRRAR
jgi:DNA-binding beta-propeller fold protein YncE